MKSQRTIRTARSGARKLLRSTALAVLAWTMFAPVAQATVDTLRLTGGAQHVVVPNAAGLNPSGAITIEAWVKPTTNAGCQTIVGKNFSTGYWLGLCSGRIRYYTNGSGSALDGFAIVPVGEWTHIAVTFDGATRTYFINGVIDNSTGTAAPLPVNLDDLGIGFDPAGGCCAFQGDIAEVRLWSIARSQEDVRTDIVKQIESPRTGLVAVWPLAGGPQETFGNFDGTAAGGATFDGGRAPPVSEAPLQIPRIQVPTMDGICDGLNGSLRIPFWNDDYPQVQWLYLGATSTYLYVCVQNMNSGPSFAAVYVDPNADATEFANPDDFRLRLPWSGTLVSEAGTGFGGYSGPGPSGATAVQYLGSEFVWQAEFRIPRSRLEMGPNGTFGLQVIDDQDNSGSLSGDWGWPVRNYWDWPAFYATVVIDDTLIPEPDSVSPQAGAFHSPSGNLPAGTVTLTGYGLDLESGVETITLFLDFTAIKTCPFTPLGWTERYCGTDEELSPGQHYLHSVVTDGAGRTTTSAVDSFRVLVDNNQPEVDVSVSVLEPPLGGSTQVAVTATDPSGITSIAVGSESCIFDGSNTEEVCAQTVTAGPGQRVVSVRIRAVDSEGLFTDVLRRVVFGNTGPDSDGDGLADAVEAVLCTSMTNPDTDGDSLNDKWEVLGLAFGNGDYVNLPTLGANPCHRDVFLQYDYEQGARVDDGVIETIVAAYQRNGITLHVEEHERARPSGNPVSEYDGASGGARVDSDGEYFFEPRRNWTHYYAYSRHNAGSGTAGYRFFVLNTYADLDNPQDPTDDCVCPLTGIDPARCGVPTEPIETNCTRWDTTRQTNLFMHELGHTMGLGHGGRKNIGSSPNLIDEYVYYPGEWDDENEKPNYRSMMNYRYNGSHCLLPGSERNLVVAYDYASEALGNLNESNLDERIVSQIAMNLTAASCSWADAGAVPVMTYTCADPDEDATLDPDRGARRTLMQTDGVQNKWRLMHGDRGWSNSGWNATANGIDWDCDGIIEASVASNTNTPLPGSTEICGDGIGSDANCAWVVSGPGDPLLGSNVDWNHMPRPASCILPYSTSRACYPQPAAYRSAIGAGGALDCRPGGAPATDCPDPGAGAGRHATRGGTTLQEALDEGLTLELPPGAELCDAQDNDGDLLIDEGCRDSDGDSAADLIDNCPTIANASQADTDRDGVGDACDALVVGQVNASLLGTFALRVDWSAVPGAIGYAIYKSTNGSDYIYQSPQGAYPSTLSAFWIDSRPVGSVNWRYRVYPIDASGAEGVASEGVYSTDDDLDGVGNVVDNCLLTVNPIQTDSDGDNIGNACDPDIAPAGGGDCSVNAADLGALKLAFFSTPASPAWNPDADFNDDGAVNAADLGIMKGYFFGPPGPSGRPNDCD